MHSNPRLIPGRNRSPASRRPCGITSWHPEAAPPAGINDGNSTSKASRFWFMSTRPLWSVHPPPSGGSTAFAVAVTPPAGLALRQPTHLLYRAPTDASSGRTAAAPTPTKRIAISVSGFVPGSFSGRGGTGRREGPPGRAIVHPIPFLLPEAKLQRSFGNRQLR